MCSFVKHQHEGSPKISLAFQALRIRLYVLRKSVTSKKNPTLFGWEDGSLKPGMQKEDPW